MGAEDGTMTIGPMRPKLDRYFVGSSTGDGMGMFCGMISELRVWSSSRTEEEITDDNKRVLGGGERNLVGYWRLNEGPGGMVFDQTFQMNHGPIKGSPVWGSSTVQVS